MTISLEPPMNSADASVSQLAGYAASFRYEALTSDAIHAVKRALVDAIGCGLGATAAEPVEIARRIAMRCRSDLPASILGTSAATTPEMATFVNGSMIRYLDFSDDYLHNDGPHPSDNIAAMLAMCEATQGSGKSLICATALAYEIVGQLVDNVTFKYRGWDYVTETSIATALASGNLLGLPREKMEHCLALAVAPNVALFQTRVGELSMWKGCAGPNASRNGVFAAMLASEGMTGASHIIEGKRGLWNQVTGPFTLGPWGGNGIRFKIERTFFKPNPMMYTGMLPVEVALDLRSTIDIDAIASIRIYLDRFCLLSSSGAEKYDPKTRETADHSIPYLVVAALLEGEITDRSFSPEQFRDSRALALLQRTSMHEDPAYTERWPDPMCCRIEIVDMNGKVVAREGQNPKGHPSRPMSDREINEKFLELACRVMKPSQARHALGLIWQADELDAVQPLFDAMRVE